MACFRLTDRALSCVAQATDGRRGTQVQCQKVTKTDWNALCHVSCSPLFGGAPLTPVWVDVPALDQTVLTAQLSKGALPILLPMHPEERLGSSPERPAFSDGVHDWRQQLRLVEDHLQRPARKDHRREVHPKPLQ